MYNGCIDMIKKWSKQHLKKTYLDDFKEKFPKGSIYRHGRIEVCQKALYEGGTPCSDFTNACNRC